MDRGIHKLLIALPLMLGVAGCDRPAEQAHEQTDVPSQQVNPVPQDQLDRAQIVRGLAVYEKNCQQCHGAEGKGQPGDWRQRKPDGLLPPPPLNDDAHAWHHPTKILRQAIEAGSPPDMGDMPPWKGKLSDAEIDDVIVYIKSLWSPAIYNQWMDIERNSMDY